MDRTEAIEIIRKNMPSDKSLPVYEALHTLIPELAESEDEIALRIIRKRMCYDPVPISDEDRRIVEHWLEKQKEPLPIPDKFSGLKSLMLQYLQSAANRKDDTEIESDTDLWGRKILDYVWKYDEHLEKQKEQKVLPGFDGLTPEEKMNHPLYLEGFDVGRDVQKVFDEQEPEWSDEDEKMLENIRYALRYAYFNSVIDEQTIEYVMAWLKSIRPQPKQVWTEEDDRICHLIMANLSESARHAITLPMETVNDFNNWLRTLQCMPPVFTDWNEEDQTLLSDALGCVTMVQELKKRGKLKNFHISCSYDELRSWVRSLKSRPRKQPSWKPSEEQPKPSGYDKALLEIKSKVDDLYEEASIGLNEYDSGLYNGIAETCMKLRGFIKARLGFDGQPEVGLEKEIQEYLEKLGGGHGGFVDDLTDDDLTGFARHFYELGLNARKED